MEWMTTEQSVEQDHELPVIGGIQVRESMWKDIGFH